MRKKNSRNFQGKTKIKVPFFKRLIFLFYKEITVYGYTDIDSSETFFALSLFGDIPQYEESLKN